MGRVCYSRTRYPGQFISILLALSCSVWLVLGAPTYNDVAAAEQDSEEASNVPPVVTFTASDDQDEDDGGSSSSSFFFNSTNHIGKRALGKAWTYTSTKLYGAGNQIIAVTISRQIAVVGDNEVIIFDKSEQNPLQVNGHAAWGAIYYISSASLRALDLKTNSFCAGGGWISNGTLVSVGGNPREDGNPGQAGNGLQALRIFAPCGGGSCQVREWPGRVRLTSNSASTVRLQDGSLLILGGMTAGGYNNNPALNTNLFPISYLLPNGQIFVAANRLAMIYDWQNNRERRLPNLPNGVRVNYPASAASTLLPLTRANNWTPSILLCGGTTLDTDGNPYYLSSNGGASSQCSRMELTDGGISRGWQVEYMPSRRLMGDAVLTPDGKVFIVNGAQSGVGGYGNVYDQVGQSNANNPNFRPCLYDPVASAGSRFTQNFPSSGIERMYHSTATLVPDGRIMISGSNPNGFVTGNRFATRYEVEMFAPPYTQLTRITWLNHPGKLNYNQQVTVTIDTMRSASSITAVIMDLGFSTHGVRMNQRHVELRVQRNSQTSLTITGPQGTTIYPPGYAWLFLIADGVPGKGRRLMIGSGAGPPVSRYAIDNMLRNT
ncbi:hypothetical protein OIO90_002708 [Microbotryomycetes sp. JL221]|nr:hypothetical protein OIO90_002708 [Microbotryomycetes sp. JL221]